MAQIIVIMGPAGSGKSTVAGALSRRTGWPMIEADTHHPINNVEKQRSGIPLTDQDRAEWLDKLAAHINALDEQRLVFACSALTQYVQKRLIQDLSYECMWILLNVPAPELSRRLKARTDHFMPESLLNDQLAALTPPDDAFCLDGGKPVDEICDAIIELCAQNPDRRSQHNSPARDE